MRCHTGNKTDDQCNSFSIATTEGEWYRKDKIFAKDNRKACFVVHLERIPLFHLATTIGPCIILIVLMIITFIMPLDRGDRVSFGVTILLSVVVSLVFVTDVLPVKGALPFFATLIIVCMGLMGLFTFFTVAIIVIHDREGSLSPSAKIIFLHYLAKMMLLGDLTKEKRASIDEADLNDPTAIELTIFAFQTDDIAVVNGEGPGDCNERTNQPATPPGGLSELICSVKEMTREAISIEMGKLVMAITKRREQLTKIIEKEDKVSDYILLAKVLDRLCVVMYVLSISAAVPMTMYLSK
ncbi:5-hydroxytryptamine receptor 3A-like [Branchiostoma floridae]|uniref:5-hydroxytryptamine receptor 3A-like n=1 Tax=Branchiostoma floridae TaxID=7739 RepID=A0A9J7HPA6_BRAFL|nr:5-hydroxytryptamine receptor 3A-like [Branchiostoma floridae]